MKEYTFFTDLDNTLIYSYKHEIGEQKKSVELYQGRWISYMTNETESLLRRIREKCPVVPITTRTIEQYERIDLGVGDFPYALTCNGGVLLINGQEDDQWYQESLKLVASATGQLKAAFDYLEKDPRRTFETRLIRDLFVFTKCDCPEQVVEDFTFDFVKKLRSLLSGKGTLILCPKTTFALLGAEKAELINRPVPPGMTYGKACVISRAARERIRRFSVPSLACRL